MENIVIGIEGDVATGKPEKICKEPLSYTGQYLKDYLEI